MDKFPRQLSHSTGVPMLLDDTRLLLAFAKPVDRASLDKFLAGFGLALEDDVIEDAVPGEAINHTDQRFWVQARHAITDQMVDLVYERGAELGLEFVGPVYRMAGERGRRALQCPLPSTILVRLRQRGGDGQAPASGAMVSAINGAAVEPKLEEVAEKSRYLNGFRYFRILNVRDVNAYDLRRQLDGNPVVADAQFETMPLVTPTCVQPSDTLFAQQWDMTRIEAGGAGTTGWDLATGTGVVVCILDTGCDLTHPDLQYSGNGINLGTMSGDGSPTGNHGTACAGIVAATFNNTLGVSGVAGNARILPVAFQNWTDAEVAAGITWAVAHGAMVISMSFGNNGWSHAIIDPAILAAFNANVVMCVATHNYNSAITYPATNPNVMAIGASDEVDGRKTPSSPDGENWGSDFGPEISVVAPGVHIPTTDRQGSAGYNTSTGTAGDYTLTFNGTSSATPHVAGLAALVRSLYPVLTNVQVRNLIERSAQKVGTVAYADTAGHPNGSWNQEMGYGRISVLRALDQADIMVRDAPSDTGAEPFTGGNFWDFSDIVVRIFDDGVFVPGDPLQSKNVERGQANYIYVRITNNGPRDARNVTISTRITPYVGLEFVYPQDWNDMDATHVAPTPLAASFASVPAGSSVMAKFRIEAAQTESLYGWVANSGWHPCLLAQVNADNDYAFSTAPLTSVPITPRLNNLAQRNLSVIDVLADAAVAFPFVAGNRHDMEAAFGLTIDRSRLPASMPLLLSLDEDGAAFPLVDFTPPDVRPDSPCGDRSLTFLETTRVKTTLGCCTGVLTVAKGSRFDCAADLKVGKVTVVGGDVIVREGKRYVDVRQNTVRMTIEKAPGAIYPMALRTAIPAGARAGDQFMVDASQQDAQGATVGGAGMVWVVH
jgi:subtilisin family serine protease